MSNYERSSGEGPGSIASLPATIGMTNRSATIGSHAPGRQVRMTYNLGDNGNAVAPAAEPAAPNRWLLPLGIGLAIGGVLALMKTQ